MINKLTLIFGLFALMIEPALAETRIPTSETSAPINKVKYVFDTMRDGSKIGSEIVEIEQQRDITNVKFTAHISVVIIIEVYHFDHVATETWNGSQFVSFMSQTDDNGTKHSLSATAAGQKINLEIDGKSSELPRTVLPGSFWSKAFVSTTQMFDDVNGKRLSIKVADLGDESLVLNGSKRQVRHYQISGDLKRDLWFDGDTLVRLKLVASDGSKIVSELRP